MKRFISLVFIYAMSQQLSAQKFDVALSELQEETRMSENYALPGGGFIGMKYIQDDRLITNWTKKKEKISILLFDASMKLVKEFNMANGEKAFGITYTVFKKAGDKFWLIYEEPGDKSKLGDLKAVEINPVTLEPAAPKTIVAFGEIGFKPGMFGTFDLKIESKASPNGKFRYFFIRKGKSDTHLCVTGAEFNVVWSKNDITADIGKKDFNSMEINNQGTVFVGYMKDELGYVAVYRNAKAPQILDAGMEKGMAKEILVLTHKNNNSITIAGGYFENSSNVRGVFKADIDASFKIGTILKVPFTESLVDLFDKDSWGSTKPQKFGIEPYYLAQLFEINDSIVDLVIEIKREIDHQTMTVVHSGNILNVYFGNGSASFTRIPKYNVAHGSKWNHYYAMPFEKKMIIFYNDNTSNLKRDINASPKLVNIEDNSVLVAAVIEPDGSVQRRLPLELDQNYMGIAEWIKPVEAGRFQVPLYFKKKSGYATISIK
ncbi:MAG: hypothetical protein ABI675_26530 [Chitinophagaceae bacterium]